MQPLRGPLLLEAWERGARESPLGRPLALLETAGEAGMQDVSIAERDARLFALRRMTFGDGLRGVLPCTACGTRMEFEVSIQSILNAMQSSPPAQETWSAGSLTFTMRPVTSRDLAAIASAADPRRRLLELCTTGADLPDFEGATVERFNRLNRDAETRFQVSCPTCGEAAQVDLPIDHFLWMEIRHAALTLLREVHELAAAYGWSERDILAMDAARRAAYLEMTRA